MTWWVYVYYSNIHTHTYFISMSNQRRKAEFVILLTEDVKEKDVIQIQKDLDIRFQYNSYIKTISAVSFYCGEGEDILNQFTPTETYVPFPYVWMHMFQSKKETDSPHKLYTDSTFEEYDEYDNNQVANIFNTRLIAYKNGAHFRFAKGQQETVNAILSHYLIKHRVRYYFWKEEVVAE